MERKAQRSSKIDTSRRRGVAPSQAGRETPRDPERIRILAYEIYESRRRSGMLGDPVSDWLEAERRLDQPAKAEPARTGTRRTPSGR